MGNVMMWIGMGILCIILFWILILPMFKKSENLLKMKARDINIIQIKKSIKELQITKRELFDD